MSPQESPILSAPSHAPLLGFSAACAILCAAIFASPSMARACSCRELTQREAFAQSAAVFEGRVISRRIEGATAGGEGGEGGEGLPSVGGGGQQILEIAVVRTWKGADQERLTLRSAVSSAACGFPFEEGESYLIYAQEAQGELRTGLCQRTQRIEEAEEDLAELGAGVTPVDIEDERLPSPTRRARGDQAGCQSCAVSEAAPSRLRAVTLLGLLAALGLRLSRRRSQRRGRRG